MNCIIIDDDPLIREVLKTYIANTANLELSKEFQNPMGVSTYLKKNKIDFVFLDVEMPEMTGIEAITALDLPQVVLISSNKEYAAEGFDYNITDFLTKPVSYDRFLKSIEKVKKIEGAIQHHEKEEDTFFIKDGTSNIKIKIDDVYYVEALGDYVKFYTTEKTITTLSTMKSIEAKLSVYNFVRIHRSYIVNLNHIGDVKSNSLELNGKTLSISRNYKANFLAQLKSL
jgi:DNA-binding LytR/AlgR family response regulator